MEGPRSCSSRHLCWFHSPVTLFQPLRWQTWHFVTGQLLPWEDASHSPPSLTAARALGSHLRHCGTTQS